MSTLVAIPVHERQRLVMRCFASLAEMALPPDATIAVFDDCSQTFDPAEAAAEAGLAANVVRQPFRIGADAMIYLIWSTFLGGHDDHLLMVDSDMIANRSALMEGLRALDRFDGLLSLYNSILHPTIRQTPDLAFKNTLGNAGTLWTRDLVALVRGAIEPGNNLDDRYSTLLRQRSIPMASTPRSYLQHLGAEGENNRYYGELEHGAGFTPDGTAQFRALAEAYDDLMSRQQHFLKRP